METARSLDRSFYAIITEPVVGYKQIAAVLVAYKVPFLQLRIKYADREIIKTTALTIREITRHSCTKFIINDDPYLALEVGADGLHLGQEDMSYAKARELVGSKMIIGLSTHNVGQVLRANALQPDYIGMGPVFATPTKEKPDPVIGVEGLKAMLDVAKIPAVAIGGIDHTNLQAVLATGVGQFCAVRWLNQSRNEADLRKNLDIMSSYLI